VHFSPDQKWIIFRANFEGRENIYAVEIKKTLIKIRTKHAYQKCIHHFHIPFNFFKNIMDTNT